MISKVSCGTYSSVSLTEAFREFILEEKWNSVLIIHDLEGTLKEPLKNLLILPVFSSADQ